MMNTMVADKMKVGSGVESAGTIAVVFGFGWRATGTSKLLAS